MATDTDAVNDAADALSLGASDGETWTLFAAGDCVLGNGARDATAPIVSDELRERASSADVAVANLEAPLRTDDAEPIPKSGPAHSTDRATPTHLRRAGFDVATLANNHTMDYGVAGLRATLDGCDEAGLRSLGAGEDRRAALEPEQSTVNGVDVALLSVCEREFGVATEAAPGTAWSGHRTAVETVREAARRADVVVVFAHGGAEYVPVPPPRRQERLRQFVDAGADVVVGHHPHVPQGWERYGDGLIAHSLGNFLFDGQADAAATSWGLTVEIRFHGATPVGVELIPTEVVDGVVAPLGETRSRSDHLAHLHRLSEITAENLEPYWQAVAVQTFYRSHSTWLLQGIGDDTSRARENPFDPEAHRPVWDSDDRRDELLALLNVVRNESHRAIVTTALATLTGETADRRTPSVSDEVDELLTWTTP